MAATSAAWKRDAGGRRAYFFCVMSGWVREWWVSRPRPSFSSLLHPLPSDRPPSPPTHPRSPSPAGETTAGPVGAACRHSGRPAGRRPGQPARSGGGRPGRAGRPRRAESGPAPPAPTRSTGRTGRVRGRRVGGLSPATAATEGGRPCRRPPAAAFASRCFVHPGAQVAARGGGAPARVAAACWGGPAATKKGGPGADRGPVCRAGRAPRPHTGSGRASARWRRPRAAASIFSQTRDLCL